MNNVLNDHSNLGEGCHIKNEVACYGIILKLVVRGEGLVHTDLLHLYGYTVLNVVKLNVAIVKSEGSNACNLDLHRNGVIIGDTIDVNVECNLGLRCFVHLNVSLAILNLLYGEGELVRAVSNLYALGNNGVNALARDIGCGRDLVIASGLNSCGCTAVDSGSIGPYDLGIIVVTVAKGVALVAELGCVELNIKGRADGLALVLVACGLLHVERDADYDLLGEVAVCGLALGEEHAACDSTVGSEKIGESANLNEAAELVLCGRCYEVTVSSNYVVVYVDDLSKITYLAVGADVHLILEGEAALVGNLHIANLGITGLPIIIIEYRSGICALGVVPNDVIL